MTQTVDRRHFLNIVAGAAGLASAPKVDGQTPGAKNGARLILLGTGGGPRPKRAVSAPAQVLVVDGTAYVIDCGDGVARQLVLANVPLTSVRHVFVTHHHSDHNADYGNLLLLAWASGLTTPVDSWGPPPLSKITRLFFDMSAYDIDTRIADEGRVPLVPLVRPHEIDKAGAVFADDRVRVSAALVDHPPVRPAYAYRFDTAARSIVISGDTARSDALVRLAEGADVLVHEAIFVSALDRVVARNPNASTLKQHLVASHTAVEDCGRIAQSAGVKTLVLSHLVPPDDPDVSDQMWVDAARAHFRGRVIVGKDLMEV
jgi:ribonuclease BN (tRNA processing enzyme)